MLKTCELASAPEFKSPTAESIDSQLHFLQNPVTTVRKGPDGLQLILKYHSCDKV